MNMLLEVIGYTIDSCQVAQAAGAHRIELCANPGEGGTTPSHGFIEMARRLLKVELIVMIRPRGGDFLYSADEFAVMQQDIEVCKNLGCDGVVMGMLTADGHIDKARCFQLVNLAYPMSVTFHRAFDRATEPLKAMEDIIAVGCDRLLTSGRQPNVARGAKLIRELVQKAADRIIIMPGGGVRAGNIASLVEKTGAVEWHSSASTRVGSRMNFRHRGIGEKLDHQGVNQHEIEQMVKVLQRYKTPV